MPGRGFKAKPTDPDIDTFEFFFESYAKGGDGKPLYLYKRVTNTVYGKEGANLTKLILEMFGRNFTRAEWELFAPHFNKFMAGKRFTADITHAYSALAGRDTNKILRLWRPADKPLPLEAWLKEIREKPIVPVTAGAIDDPFEDN